MAISRIVPKQVPVATGRDSRYTLRHNPAVPGSPWWVYYEPQGADPIPADAPHADVVELVNTLKQQMGAGEGGSFTITEHGQVIARMSTPTGGPGNAVHCIGLVGAVVGTYTEPLIFGGGALDPRSEPNVGELWQGPLCGRSYSFAAPANPKPPSHCFDEIFIQINDQMIVLSVDAGIAVYPPVAGELAIFLASLRRFLPQGGRFRVNEFGRAFTSNDNTFLGTVPLDQWFQPLTALS